MKTVLQEPVLPRLTVRFDKPQHEPARNALFPEQKRRYEQDAVHYQETVEAPLIQEWRVASDERISLLPEKSVVATETSSGHKYIVAENDVFRHCTIPYDDCEAASHSDSVLIQIVPVDKFRAFRTELWLTTADYN